MFARIVLTLLWLVSVLEFGAPAQRPQAESVGVPGRIEELVLPAPELEVLPLQRDQPLIVRILAKRPHGTAFRYDLEYTGLVPGTYDLREYLRPSAGTGAEVMAELPPIAVEIRSLLPAGQVLPHHPTQRKLSDFGGYSLGLWVFAALWGLGLWAILRLGGNSLLRAKPPSPPPLTLAEQLQPLVERALRGEMQDKERARLELLLLAFWRRQLGLEQEAPAQVFAKLRNHAQAGPLLQSLESWLHAPNAPKTVDLKQLLAPYQNLPAEPETPAGPVAAQA